MRIIERAQFKLTELFNNFKYQLPKDPEKLLYDFYFMFTFGENIGSRDDAANYVIAETRDIIVNKLTLHMIEAVRFALSCELRHIVDQCNYDPNKLQLRISREFIPQLYSALVTSPKTVDEPEVDARFVSTPRRIRIATRNSPQERLRAYKLLLRLQRQLNVSDFELSKIAEDTFISLKWDTNYGGKNWAMIAKAFNMLVSANTTNQKGVAIDHTYNLQHNTGSVFTKLDTYYKDNGYDWLKSALNWKRDIIDIQGYYRKVSTQLRPMVAFISKTVYNKSLDDYYANSIKISGSVTNCDFTVEGGDKLHSVFDFFRDLAEQNIDISKLLWLTDADVKDSSIIYKAGGHVKVLGGEILRAEIDPTPCFSISIVNTLINKNVFLKLCICSTLVINGATVVNCRLDRSTWLRGKLKDSYFEYGTWKNGVFENSTWFDGVWEDGVWVNGTWRSGIWKDGVWKNGVWIKGKWENGIWENGRWMYGNWENGEWRGGVWKDGIWRGGIWRGGQWYKGNIVSKKYGETLEEVKIDPAKFYALEDRSSTLEELKDLINRFT